MSYRASQILDAVLTSNFSAITYQVSRGNVNYTDPKNRMSILMWAVALGRLATVELLLSRGASIFPVDGLGFTVLHRAVWSGDAAVVRTLLFLSPESRIPEPSYFYPKGTVSDGASVAEEWSEDRKDTISSSPSIISHRKSDQEMSVFTRWLVAESEREVTSKLLQAEPTPALNWRDGARRLVDAVHTSTGRTPLMLASVKGDANLVDFLVNVCGADMYRTDLEGFTAFDLAALCGHLRILQIFLVKADGDGTGRAFPCLQQRAEEFGETAKTIPQRNLLKEMNRMLAVDYSRQSYVSAC